MSWRAYSIGWYWNKNKLFDFLILQSNIATLRNSLKEFLAIQSLDALCEFRAQVVIGQNQMWCHDWNVAYMLAKHLGQTLWSLTINLPQSLIVLPPLNEFDYTVDPFFHVYWSQCAQEAGQLLLWKRQFSRTITRLNIVEKQRIGFFLTSKSSLSWSKS